MRLEKRLEEKDTKILYLYDTDTNGYLHVFNFDERGDEPKATSSSFTEKEARARFNFVTIAISNQESMTVREFLKRTNSDDDFYKRPLVVLDSGDKLSIQASRSHYCSPRESGDIDYNSVEVAFYFNYTPNKGEEQGVCTYGWVPVEELEELVESKGGINIKETFK